MKQLIGENSGKEVWGHKRMKEEEKPQRKIGKKNCHKGTKTQRKIEGRKRFTTKDTKVFHKGHKEEVMPQRH